MTRYLLAALAALLLFPAAAQAHHRRVHHHRKARHGIGYAWYAGATPAEPPAGPVPNPYPAPSVASVVLQPVAAEAASAWWAEDGPSFSTQFFHTGQCTELAANHAPAIVQRIGEVTLARSYEGAEAGAYFDGNAVAASLEWYASDWDALAAASGIPVGSSPEVGSLMVFHTGVPGHIAYVTAVGPQGEVTIEEEHAPELWTIDTRTITSQEIASYDDVDFIY